MKEKKMPLSLPTLWFFVKKFLHLPTLFDFSMLAETNLIFVWSFLFLLKNIDCGYSFEPPHNQCFEPKKKEKKLFNFLNLKIIVVTVLQRMQQCLVEQPL